MYIHRTKTRLLGVLLSLLAIAAGATAAGEATFPGGRRFMRERSLLQYCDVCPSSSVATAACQAVSQSQVPTIRADLISRCSNVALNPARCCELYSSAQWSAYSGCACSTVIPGLNAFVDGAALMSACGCGGRPSSTGAAAGPTPALSISDIYSAVSFSSGGRSAPPNVVSATTPGNASATGGGGTSSVVTFGPGQGVPPAGGGGSGAPPSTPPSP